METDCPTRQVLAFDLLTTLESIEREVSGLTVTLGGDRAAKIRCRHFVVACGGKSIPKMGATGFGYEIAEKFELAVTEARPALVPLTFGEDVLADFSEMAGVAANASVSCGRTAFEEALLFTHRGLSGPVILQISSYWREKQPIRIAFLPGDNVPASLASAKRENGRRAIWTVLSD